MLCITNLTVAVETDTVLKNINLKIGAGQLHILMGPNGSGKSSLAQTIVGNPAYTVQSGSILFNHANITNAAIDQRARSGIFLSFQNPPEIPGVQVITFLREIYGAVKGQTVSTADFQSLINQYVQLLSLDQSLLYRGFNEGFSGGQKKRLEILQLLLLQPQLVLLDEIDSGLDIEGLELLYKAINHLRTLNPDSAFLCITHQQRIIHALNPDGIHIMYEGQIVDSGDKKLLEKIERKGYREYQPTI